MNAGPTDTGPTDTDIVIASNRGPVSFHTDETGELSARRGAGGLVSGLGPLVHGTGATWIASAITPGDHIAASQGVIESEGFRTRLLNFDDATFRMVYDTICNSTLWFAHHGLWDLSREPRFDTHWYEAWDTYRAFNRRFAEAVTKDAPIGATVLIQDYHLCLMAPVLRSERPDLRLAHFTHTPFAGPDQIRVLPDVASSELLEGMAAHHICGFHTQRWADDFQATCRQVIGRVPTVIVAPLAPNPEDITSVAGTQRCADALASLEDEIGNRKFIVRVDRIELSKNILRGFHAFDDLLERHPRWRGEVVFGAFCYPSREGLSEYLAYRNEVEAMVARLNEKWATPTWKPIILNTSDDFPSSVAALRRYDVLLINPIRDGLNLVAMEGPLVNERDGAVALSTEAGAFEHLGGLVRSLNPFDISECADVLCDALETAPTQRATEASELLARIRSRTPADWLNDQLRALSAF